jgi:hypothetical protein
MKLLTSAVLLLALLAASAMAAERGSTREWNLHKENGYLAVLALIVAGGAFIIYFVAMYVGWVKSSGRRVAFFSALACFAMILPYGTWFFKYGVFEREITNAGPAPFATEVIFPAYWNFQWVAQGLMAVGAASYMLTGNKNSIYIGIANAAAGFLHSFCLYQEWGNARWFFSVMSGLVMLGTALFGIMQFKRYDLFGLMAGFYLLVLGPWPYYFVFLYGRGWWNEMTLWNELMAYMILDVVRYVVVGMLMTFTALSKKSYAMIYPGSRADTEPTYAQSDDPTLIWPTGKKGQAAAYIATGIRPDERGANV